MAKEPVLFPRLRLLVEMYYDVQAARKRAHQRILSYKRMGVSSEDLDYLREVYGWVLGTEDRIRDEIKREVGEEPIWEEWLSMVKGIGPVLSAGLIAYYGYREDYPSISSAWHLAGLHVLFGKAPRRARGEKASWNTRLRTIMWNVATSIIRSGGGGFYRGAYERFKEEEVSKGKVPREVSLTDAIGDVLAEDVGRCKAGRVIVKRKSRRAVLPQVLFSTLQRECKRLGKSKVKIVLSPGHIENRARRKLAKLVSANYVVVARTLRGLPVPKPYAHSLLGHRDLVEPMVDTDEGPMPWSVVTGRVIRYVDRVEEGL